jgi:hypothetical protein
MTNRSSSLPRTSTLVVVAAFTIISLIVSLASVARPALADHSGFDHQPLPIDTATFDEDAEECEDADLAPGEVLLHFIANHQTSTDPLTLTLTLEGGATVSEESNKIVAGGKTHHFDFIVEGDVVITDLAISSGIGNVRLSHVCRGEVPVTGSLEVLKTDEAGAPLAGAQFTVEGFTDPFTTEADGTFCVDGLTIGAELDVTETAAPPGFDPADPATQTVTVTVEGDCDARGDAPPDAIFVNVAIGEGVLEIDKFFCPGDETRTEIVILGPVAPEPLVTQQQNGEGCTVGADVTFEIWMGDTLVDTVVTGADGIVEVTLAAGTYLLVEPESGASAEFTIADGQLTAAIVTNFVAAEVGQVKVVKFFCETGGTGVTFTIEGIDPPPSLEGCEPGDASFELDGQAFTTTGGIALLDVAAGTYVLAETDPNVATSGEFDVVAGEITTIIVVNYPAAPAVVASPSPSPAAGVLGGTPTPTPRGAVLGGAGGPAQLPNTASGAPIEGAAVALSLLMLASLGTMAFLRLARDPAARGRPRD